MKAALRAEQCGAAVTTIEGVNDADTDPFALRRVVIGGDDDLDVVSASDVAHLFGHGGPTPSRIRQG